MFEQLVFFAAVAGDVFLRRAVKLVSPVVIVSPTQLVSLRCLFGHNGRADGMAASSEPEHQAWARRRSFGKSAAATPQCRQ
jgi:hypothetical protein